MQFLVTHDRRKSSDVYAKGHNELQRQRNLLLTDKHPKNDAPARTVCLYQATSKEQLTEWLKRMKISYVNIELYSNDASSPNTNRHGAA